MENVKVGMWNLPGLKFEKSQLSNELIDEMKEWTAKHKCGMCMSNTLWAFKTAAQRDWFVLRWIDSIPKVADE